MKWIQSIKRTGNLPLQGKLFICDSHFDESCFQDKDNKRFKNNNTFSVMSFLNFVSAFLKN